MDPYISQLKTALYLLWNAPREYLYTLTIPSDKKMYSVPYDPHSTEIAHELMENIHRKMPDLEIYFVGAASLGIAGQGDIDIILISPHRDFKRYIPTLTKMFDNPLKRRSLFTDWDFIFKGFQIELTLTYKGSSLATQQLKTFSLLKNNKKALHAYEQLKNDSQGMPMNQYVRRRLLFFTSVMGIKAGVGLGELLKNFILDLLSVTIV